MKQWRTELVIVERHVKVVWFGAESYDEARTKAENHADQELENGDFVIDVLVGAMREIEPQENEDASEE